MKPITKSILAGIIGSVSLFAIYTLILSLLNSPAHAYEQFLLLQPYMSILVLGFGVQIGLMVYLKARQKECHQSMAPAVASGSVSTGAMIACCLHHTTDVLPLLGLTAAATFLTKYQTWFLLIGIVSNIAGIAYLIYAIYKHTYVNNKTSHKTRDKDSYKQGGRT